MPRKQPIEHPPAYTKKSPAITMIRNYTLLTPMFGGGVKPRYADTITPIRGSAIRGQLRFWWRATRGGQFGGSLEKMRAAEEAIWGSAAAEGKQGESVVKLSVSSRGAHIDKPALKRDPNYQNINEIHEYVGFPLRPENENGDRNIDALLLMSVQFELKITCLKNTIDVGGRSFNIDQELNAALWTWETFGGIGARTRRGFGAIDCNMVNDQRTEHPASHQEVIRWIQEKLKMHIQQVEFPANIPHLDPDTFIKYVYDDRDPQKIRNAKAMWEKLVSRLKQFRSPMQGKWPEAAAIRRLNTNQSPFSETQPGFVRSEFGLPIMFHFARDLTMPDATLTPQRFDRMASPLILRPLKCADGNYVGLVALLRTPYIETIPLNLKIKSNNYSVSGNLYQVEEANLPSTLKEQERVIEAFINWL